MALFACQQGVGGSVLEPTYYDGQDYNTTKTSQTFTIDASKHYVLYAIRCVSSEAGSYIGLFSIYNGTKTPLNSNLQRLTVDLTDPTTITITKTGSYGYTIRIIQLD